MTVDPVLTGAPAVALTGLAGGYRPRHVTPLLPWRADGWLIKPYVVTAAGRSWDDLMVSDAEQTALQQFRFHSALGGLGLGVAILHLGEGGAYLVAHSWAQDYGSRVTVLTGVDVADLRLAANGVSPCVWELEVLAHERAAYVTHILAGGVDTESWLDDVLDTRVG